MATRYQKSTVHSLSKLLDQDYTIYHKELNVNSFFLDSGSLFLCKSRGTNWPLKGAPFWNPEQRFQDVLLAHFEFKYPATENWCVSRSISSISFFAKNLCCSFKFKHTGKPRRATNDFVHFWPQLLEYTCISGSLSLLWCNTGAMGLVEIVQANPFCGEVPKSVLSYLIPSLTGRGQQCSSRYL